MVALRQRRLPSADINPADIIQGDVGASTHQVFRILRSGLIQHPKTKRYVREFLLDDQFGNTYITYFAVGADDEDYQWPPQKACRVKPSVIKEHGGVTADLFDKYRAAAFHEFARIDEAIRQTQFIANQTAKQVVDAQRLIIEPPATKTQGLYLPT